MNVEVTSVNPEASLVKVARAALAAQLQAENLPWEAIDLSDSEQCQFGDYELKALIGKGGMGVVYRAYQKSLDREVAIKFIAADLADDPNFVARFLAEAQAAARLHHPNIVPVHEVGSVDCLHYFSMPLLQVETLADVLEARSLSMDAIVTLMRKLCSAVAYAHSLGLLHLDLKPANIMLDRLGEPLIGDFGLARRIDAHGGVDAQEVSGTPAYMAPEQIQIRQFRLTRRTDLYALGAILYRLLTGRPPHGEGTPQQLMQNAIAGRITPISALNPAVPADLAAICMACLALHAEDRYESVAALGADLARFADGNPVSVRRASWWERLQRSVRRNPGVSTASAVAVLALVLGLSISLWQWQQAELARERVSLERNRQAQLAALLAHSMPALNNENATAEWGDSADRIVDWLESNEPDPEEQRALLDVFVQALRDAGREDLVGRLSWSIPERLGRQYRLALSDQLLQRADAESLAVALLLRIREEGGATDAKLTRVMLQRAAAEFGNDRRVLAAAVMVCAARPTLCQNADFASLLAQAARDQNLELLQLLHGSDGEVVSSTRLQAMAAATDVGDPLPEQIGMMERVMRDFPPPRSVVAPLSAVMPEAEATLYAQRQAIATLPTPRYPPLLKKCDPNERYLTPEDVPSCIAVARLMFSAEQSKSIVTRMVGSVLLRRLVPDTAEGQAAMAFRRQYVWLGEQGLYDSLTAEELTTFDRDTASVGEWPAMLNRARARGLALEPPKDWVPKDPEALLLPEQRGRK